jgi:hypothetical protein
MFKTLVENATHHQIRPPKYQYKDFEVEMLKMFLHCSFRLEIHEYDKKKGSKIKLEI